MKTRSASVIAGVLSGAVGAALALTAERLLFQSGQPLAAVDLASVVERQMRTLRERGGTPEQVQAAAREWGHRADRVLRNLAHDHRAALIVKQAVVAGAPDLTRELEQRMVEAVDEAARRDPMFE